MNKLPPAAQDFLRRYADIKDGDRCSLTHGCAVVFTQPDGRLALRIYDEYSTQECEMTWDKDLETNR